MIRLAMWSGPRNLSTAMMRSFENRPDSAVVDEPLYAHYLASTRRPHPGFEEILASQSQDWREVTSWLSEAEPEGATLWYQKHMTHHLLPSMGRAWMESLTHCLLIRDPRLVLASYARTRDDVVLEDLGFVQQQEIYDYLVEANGTPPLVLSSRDVLLDPEGTLRLLCDALAIDFYPEMLNWPAGPRETDGVWAKHWYASVEKSSGFGKFVPKDVEVPRGCEGILEVATPIYDRLFEERLRVRS